MSALQRSLTPREVASYSARIGIMPDTRGPALAARSRRPRPSAQLPSGGLRARSFPDAAAPTQVVMSAGVPGRGAERTREDRELFVRYRDGDNEARDQLVERFLPLARQLARRYQRASEPLDDLLQVASMGLIKAIDRFDADREIAFSSYAVPTILGEIKRHFRDRTWAVRVPRDLQELTLKVDRAVGELSEDLRRQPSVSEIAEAVAAEEEDVLEALQAGGAYRAVSFEAPRGGEG